jgi:hypothetical protein
MSRKKPTIVSTSWDDGDPLDLRVSGLLRNGLRTLLDYVANRNGVQHLTNGKMATQFFGEQFLPTEVAA